MTKAILIDIDDTLLDFHKNARAALKAGLEARGVPFREEYFTTFESMNAALWQRIERKEITNSELFAIRFPTIFRALGIGGFDPLLFEDEFRKNLHSGTEPVPGAEALLRYLSAKYAVYAVSNSLHEQQEVRLRKAGFLPFFSGIFTSGLFGVSKPSPEFFDAVFSRIDPIRPEETFLIGDSLSADISGSLAYGIPTIWFNYRRKDEPENLPVKKTVYSLNEIQNLL